MIKRKTKNFLQKAIPMWMVLMLMLQSTLAVALAQNYLMRKNFQKNLTQLSKTTKNPQELVQILKQEVLPQNGFALSVTWGNIGKELMETGVIDKQKYQELFVQEKDSLSQMKYLEADSKDHMKINEKNSRFMVNTLWAIGLVNKSKVLDEGPMKTYGEGKYMNFASTGGWTLGSKPTSELYSSTPLIKLTDSQEALVKKIAENVYRPCCGNPTSFPDCNHGMAALAYIEIAVKQGVPEDKIYKDLLKLNSFWFPQNYVELATYMNKQGKDWKTVDAKKMLSSEFSSAQGAQKTRQLIQNVPGVNVQGGGCGA